MSLPRKLTAAQAKAIRERSLLGERRCALARDYGVSERCIRGILSFETYQEAGGPKQPEKPPKNIRVRPLAGAQEKRNRDWVDRAALAKERGGCTWPQVAMIVGKTIHKVRYALDEKYRDATKRGSRKRYENRKRMRENPTKPYDFASSALPNLLGYRRIEEAVATPASTLTTEANGGPAHG